METSSSKSAPAQSQSVLKLWNRLRKVSELEFSFQCRKIPPSYETRKGKGKVSIQIQNETSLTFFEKGTSRSVHSGHEMAFTNIFRWRMESEGGTLCLEHLRLGIEKPVFLFRLIPIEEHLFKSLKPHECKEDAYYGSVLYDEHYVHLNWRIIGPRKNEMITTVYS